MLYYDNSPKRKVNTRNSCRCIWYSQIIFHATIITWRRMANAYVMIWCMPLTTMSHIDKPNLLLPERILFVNHGILIYFYGAQMPCVGPSEFCYVITLAFKASVRWGIHYSFRKTFIVKSHVLRTSGSENHRESYVALICQMHNEPVFDRDSRSSWWSKKPGHAQ